MRDDKHVGCADTSESLTVLSSESHSEAASHGTSPTDQALRQDFSSAHLDAESPLRFALQQNKIVAE